MADRDVKLIIRAKNEATRAIDAVSEALKELSRDQENVGRTGQKADSTLAQLGTEIGRLGREIQGLTALSKVASEIQKVEQAIANLEGEVNKSVADLQHFGQEAQKAGENAKRLAAETEKLQRSLKAEKATLKELRAERSQASADLRKAEAAYKRLDQQLTKHNAKSDPRAQQALQERAAEVEKARVASEAAVRAYDKQKAVITDLSEKLRASSAELRTVSTAQDRFQRSVTNTTAAVDAKRKKLEEARQSLSEMQTLARGASSTLGGVALEEKAIAAAAREAQGALDSVNTEFAAMQRFSTGDGGFADPRTAEALRKQREEVEKARQAYEVLDARARRLATAMAGVAAPTQRQVALQREAAEAARQAKMELDRQIAALNRMPSAVNNMRGLSAFFKAIYGEGRQAMSMMQRLRGELLSLSAAYVGFYAAIENVGNVIKAYQMMEAAQNRLGAVFNQDNRAIREELDWLERQASRLGISFGELSGQYSKFAVAAKAANFENEATRRIFLSVAEAGRVNKLSMDDMVGIFRALEQMISKGKIQAEELRQQMGDRLPGAFNILAAALGVSTAQLNEMMEKGEVLANQATLLKFADELDRRFGKQLAESLRSTTALMGQFSNEMFQAQLRVARGGFIDAFNEALKELNAWFQSREGQEFFLSLGAALGNFVSILSKVPRAFGYVADAAQAFVAVKLAVAIQAATIGMRTATGASMTLAGAYAAARTGVISFASSVTAATASMRASIVAATTLSGVLRTIGTLIMRIPAIAVISGAMYLATELIGDWIAGVDETTSALEEHRTVMQSVLAEYDKVKDKTDGWKKALDTITADQAAQNFRRVFEQLEKELEEFGSKTTVKFEKLEGDASKLFDMRNAVRNGEMTIRAFIQRVEEMYDQLSDDATRKFAEELLVDARRLRELADATGEAARLARDKRVVVEGLTTALHLYGEAQQQAASDTKTSSDAMKEATVSAEDYAKALGVLKGMVPGLAEEMKQLSDYAKLDEAYKTLMKGARSMSEIDAINRWYRDARQAVRDRYTDFEGQYVSQRGTPQGRQMEELVSATTRVAEQLGLSAKDLLTVFSYETGGTLDPWKAGPITKYGQHRGLIQWGEPQQRQYGVSATSTITEQIQAVGKYLLDHGVKPGDGLLQIYAAINAGSAKNIHASDAAAGGAPGTVLDKVSSQMEGHKARAEGLLAAYSGVVETTQEVVRQEERANEERRRGQEATTRQIEDNEHRIRQQELIAAGKGREAAIEDAIRQARQANKNISEEELQVIAEQAGRLWDLQNAHAGVEAAEKRVNDLMQMRQELTEQIRLNMEMGNYAAADALKARLDGVNIELERAIDNAIAMWKAIGGPEADLAIAKLQTAKLSIAETGVKAIISGEQIAKQFAGVLTNAFKSMAQAIAEGEDAWDAFSRAFLQGIAEMLIEIGELILRWAILKAIQGVTGIPLLGASGSVLHDGGIVGMGGTTRSAPALLWGGAARYHEGGIAGLKPGEIPAILERGEVVDPGDGSVFRRVFGEGGSGGTNLKIINTFDAADVISEGLSSPAGEQTFINMVKRNATKINQALGR